MEDLQVCGGASLQPKCLFLLQKYSGRSILPLISAQLSWVVFQQNTSIKVLFPIWRPMLWNESIIVEVCHFGVWLYSKPIETLAVSIPNQWADQVKRGGVNVWVSIISPLTLAV
jgi:hypothetical protein